MSKHKLLTEEEENVSKRIKSERMPTSEREISASIPIPGLSLATSWHSSRISLDLPPLPPISDPEIEKAVFTHPGTGQQPTYERLEWLGDAYLETTATNLIYQTFTSLSAGRCSQIREQMIRNITLAGYFREYKLESKARLPKDMQNIKYLGRGRSEDKDLMKTQADMFEAYVAGLILSDPQHGLSTTINWLKSLWGRTIISHIKAHEHSSNGSEKAAADSAEQSTEASTNDTGIGRTKENLAKAIGAKGIRIRYEDIENGGKKDRNLGLPLYTVGVYLDGWGEVGKQLGVGTALKKKEAAAKAAEQALQNKKMLKVYEAKKKVFVDAQRAAEAAAVLEREAGG